MSKKLFFIVLALFILMFSGISFAIVHPQYSSFSSPEQGFSFNNNTNAVLLNDTAIYKTSYYSVNGGAWRAFNLTGTAYNNDANWLAGISAGLIQALGSGEHYIIAYSCTHIETNSSWNCHDNRWQLIVVNNTGLPGNYSANDTNSSENISVSCGNIICGSDEYCSNGVCLLNVSGNTYFVSLNGSDSNPGTFSQPWGTWQKAFITADAGDIVYFRGGIWYPSQASYGNNIMMINPPGGLGHSGTAEEPIRYFNYPGEKPVLDCSLINPPGSFNTGLELSRVDFASFKGLTIRNVRQPRAGVEAFGMVMESCTNLRLENMVIHDIGGNAFRFSGAPLGYYGPMEYDNNYFINCDAYNNYDPYNMVPGNAADGFKAIIDVGQYVHFSGCRAWNNSDDGFDVPGPGIAKVENCWSFDGGWWDSGNEGTGFKIGAIGTFVSNNTHHRIISNCIAANGRGLGFFDLDYEPYYRSNSFIYNNIAYKQGVGYGASSNAKIPRTTSYINNIVYASQTIGPVGVAEEIEIPLIVYPESHNTWDWYDVSPGSYPWWVYAEDISVADNDFISLDVRQLKAPRKTDNSLPDVTFGHLAQGSDLIDAGTVIPGHHCATAGAHPGENCVEWYGDAPDIGPFESNY